MPPSPRNDTCPRACRRPSAQALSAAAGSAPARICV
jgi:hypothetical protein